MCQLLFGKYISKQKSLHAVRNSLAIRVKVLKIVNDLSV